MINSNVILNVLNQLSQVDEVESTIMNESATPGTLNESKKCNEGNDPCNMSTDDDNKDDDKKDKDEKNDDKINENAQLESITMEDDTSTYYCKDCDQYFLGMDVIDEEVICPLCGSDNVDYQGEVVPEGVTLEEGMMIDDSGECYTLNESMKKIVVDGKVQTVSVKRKKKVRLSSDQKAALKKARKKAKTGSAKKARAKSMKIRVKRGLTESEVLKESVTEVVLPNQLVLNESLGLALVSENPDELEGVAKDLGFDYADDCYVKEVGDSVLVMENAEGEVDGVVIYGVDVTGNTVDEETLGTLLDQAGIDVEDADAE